MKFKDCPEIICTVEAVDTEGNDNSLGDKIIGVSIRMDKQTPEGLVTIDVREFSKKHNVCLRIPYRELISAIGDAAINADRED